MRSSVPQSFKRDLHISLPPKQKGLNEFIQTDLFLSKMVKQNSSQETDFDRNSHFIAKAADNFIVSNRQLPQLMCVDTPVVRLKYSDTVTGISQTTKGNKQLYRSLAVGESIQKLNRSNMDSIISSQVGSIL